MPQFDEVGVLPPLGRWDPLQIREQGPERYRRFVEMEIKHGRLAMAGFVGVLTTYSGIRWPGYLSTSENILFSDIPGGQLCETLQRLLRCLRRQLWTVRSRLHRSRTFQPNIHVAFFSRST